MTRIYEDHYRVDVSLTSERALIVARATTELTLHLSEDDFETLIRDVSAHCSRLASASMYLVSTPAALSESKSVGGILTF
jgi:hypothetical protein